MYLYYEHTVAHGEMRKWRVKADVYLLLQYE